MPPTEPAPFVEISSWVFSLAYASSVFSAVCDRKGELIRGLYILWRMVDLRLELFQGVLENYKIAGRDNYVKTIDTNPPVAAFS